MCKVLPTRDGSARLHGSKETGAGGMEGRVQAGRKQEGVEAVRSVVAAPPRSETGGPEGWELRNHVLGLLF